MDVKSFVPDWIEFIGNKFGFEYSGSGKLARNVRVCDVFAIDVKEHRVRVGEVLSPVNVDVDSTMEENQLGFVNFILI